MIATLLMTLTLAGQVRDLPAVGSQVRLEGFLFAGPQATANRLAYIKFARSFNASDREGFKELEEEGLLWRLPLGTHARILEYHREFDPVGVMVRVLDGKDKGKVVWIPDYCLPLP
jgi:hypothetical protein